MGRSDNKLQQARVFQEKRLAQISEKERPVYHMSAPVGWLNDPNGFSVYQGQIHLFFQYHPYRKEWGPMYWGHAKSNDFIKWEYLPVALAPDEDYDCGGCFSGSALEAGEKHVLIYTGVSRAVREDGSEESSQTQCIAVGDGTEYEKYEGNPVIRAEDMPTGFRIHDFRDPKVWKDGAGYSMVVGHRSEDGSGQILLFHSPDLKTWNFVTVLDQSGGKLGKMWECPDFYPLGSKDILCMCPQHMYEDEEFHRGNNTAFLIGRYERAAHRFIRESVQSADYGLDFYAPQSLLTSDGRRIMIGWMQSWDAKFTPETFRWTGMMTVPRELTWKNGRVCQAPVRELEQYRKNRVEYRHQLVQSIAGEMRLPGIQGRAVDLEITITGSEFKEFSIHFARNEQYECTVIYDRKQETLTIDRSRAAVEKDVVCRRCVPVRAIKPMSDHLRLRLLLDRFSAEIFAGNGEMVLSMTYYTPLDADQIVFAAVGTAYMDVTKYDIEAAEL